MPKVYILILTYNSQNVIRACLDSVLGLNYSNFKVVVVDNTSKDNTLQAVENFGDKVILLCNQQNLGFSGGNNVGIKYALRMKAEYVFLLNPDTTIEENALETLVNTAQTENKIGIVAPKALYPGPQKRIMYAGGVLDWSLAKNYHRGQGEPDQGQYSQVEETGFASGASLLIKKELVRKIGLLDENYFLYYEDADWCVRAQRTGYKVVYQPRAVVYHQESTVTQKGSPNYYYYFTRNRLYFVKKFFPLTSAAKIYFFESLRFIKNLLKLCKTSWREQALAILAGIYDFVLSRFGPRFLLE